MVGKGKGLRRLANTFFDHRFTEWLPIYCYVIEHPEGMIVVDTGIPAMANAPVDFPPWMRLVQHAARFRIEPEQEIGPEMLARGLSPQDVRWVVLTHLHQDHDGGLNHFPQAEFVVSRAEYQAASGLMGRMGGYLNQRWPGWFAPTLVDFTGEGVSEFSSQHRLTAKGDVFLLSTPGHSPGHMSLLVEEADHVVMLAGDSAYSQALLLDGSVDGIGPDPALQKETKRRILQFAAHTPTVFLPAHEWEAERRLVNREPVRADLIQDTKISTN
jgi:glyoxylase-like metal-dependent hydrolase (beta-lactamase superfamily II)